MVQKLSAMRYIKNNKRRVSVLIVSLTLCFVLTYVSFFFLSTTTETFRSLLVDNAEKMQFVKPSARVFDLDHDKLCEDEYLRQYNIKLNELMNKLKAKEGITDVFMAETVYGTVQCFVGRYTFELPLVSKDKISLLLKHMEATLAEGRLPEKNNEIVLSESAMKNEDYRLGDNLKENHSITIVGILECEYYFGCGIYEGDTYNNQRICILSDGSIDDLTLLLNNIGYKFDKSKESIIDKVSGEEDLQNDVINAIESGTDIVYVFILAVLFLVLLIVYTTYLRDRQNEWCLYSSIGYSKKAIYFSIMRELLFTFAVSVLAGGIIIFLTEVALDYCMIRPMGIMCRYFYPNVLLEILCSYVLLLGMLQLPVRYELYRIRTIDAMDDDLN